ncbi:MAG: dephospho-CoA kinase [Candidatus Actinomarina sp.]
MDKKTIVITGPIGSGKSEVLSIIKKLGYNTVDLDLVSGNILLSNESKDFLYKNFPSSLVNGEVSRENIAEIVFTDKSKLAILESFLHPKVLIKLNEIIKENDITFVEVSAPKNLHNDFHTIVIWASEEDRVKRLINRGMEINDIKNRIKSQPADEWWHSIGDLIINNDLDQLEIDINNYINGFINE